MDSIRRHRTNHRASAVVCYGEHVETAGIVALPGTPRDIASQTRSVLMQLEDLLRLVGTDRTALVSVQIWLADMADFDAMNEVYDAWVDGRDQPARACVGADLAHEAYRIEIKARAYVGGR